MFLVVPTTVSLNLSSSIFAPMVKARPSSVGSMVKGTAFVFTSRAADAIVGFLFSIVAARLIGKDLYGLLGATIGIIGILSLLAHMGIPNATTKYVS